MPVIFISLTEDEIHRRFTNCAELLEFFNDRSEFSCKLVNEENTLTVCVHDGLAFVRFDHKGRPIQVAVSNLAESEASAEAKWFKFGASKAKVESRHCLDMRTLRKTVEHFFQTGEQFPDIKWEISR